MEEIARVYGDALFEAAKDDGKLEMVHEQLGEFTEAMSASHDLRVFLFSPYFSSEEKREGLAKVVSGAESQLINFLGLLAEKHRMPAIFRIRDHFDRRWAEENRRLEVKLTSAVDLDRDIVERVEEAIASQTGQTIDMEAEVDPELLGGLVLRVGNRVLDASIRNQLERLRKEVAQAA